jgi:hypothetical protein
MRVTDSGGFGSRGARSLPAPRNNARELGVLTDGAYRGAIGGLARGANCPPTISGRKARVRILQSLLVAVASLFALSVVSAQAATTAETHVPAEPLKLKADDGVVIYGADRKQAGDDERDASQPDIPTFGVPDVPRL